jgi:predicted RNase H-like HicB family nuclease
VTALVDWDAVTRQYVGVIPGIPGAHSRGATPDELQANLKEVLLQLRLKESRANGEPLNPIDGDDSETPAS